MIARLAAALAAFALGACMMVGPDYERPAPALPDAYPGASADPGPTVPDEWWKAYGDATLDTLVASALERNVDVRIAVARIEETDANLREAGAAFLPAIDLTGAASRSRVSTATAAPIQPGAATIRNNIRLSAGTAFELDFWGRLRRGLEATRANALGSRYAREVVRLTLVGSTTQAYFALRSLDAQLAVTRETIATRTESLDLARRRASGGIASDLDVNQAETALRDATAQRIELERQRAVTEHQLGVLSGRLDTALAAEDLRILPVPPAPPPGLPSALLERRPDVRQAEQSLVAANAQIGVAKAAMFPTISLTGSLGGESRALATLLSSNANIWSIGFGLTLPLFDAGRIAARTDAAGARQRQALGNYQRAVETAFREVADALTNVRQGEAAEEPLRARLAAARETLRLARIRYEAGYSAYLEVLDAQRTANEAELALVRNRQARLAASVDLMKALGGGWSGTVQEPALAPAAAAASR